jgi:hypothetical protein
VAGYLHVLGAKEVKLRGVLSCSLTGRYAVIIIIIIITVTVIAVDNVSLFDGREKLANTCDTNRFEGAEEQPRKPCKDDCSAC